MSHPVVVGQRRPPSKVLDPRGPLLLRAPEMTDVPSIVEAIAESVDALRAFMPWGHSPQTLDAQYARMPDVIAAYWRGDEYNLHLFDPASGRFLGCIGLHRRAMNPQALEIGYWVRTSATGCGVCTRAVEAALVLAFEHFGCVRVQCGFDTANAASARVNAKVGFRVEGDLRHYGPAGDDAMRANGWQADEVNRMTSLTADEARALPWYASTRERLEVIDWLGRPVK